MNPLGRVIGPAPSKLTVAQLTILTAKERTRAGKLLTNARLNPTKMRAKAATKTVVKKQPSVLKRMETAGITMDQLEELQARIAKENQDAPDC